MLGNADGSVPRCPFACPLPGTNDRRPLRGPAFSPRVGVSRPFPQNLSGRRRIRTANRRFSQPARRRPRRAQCHAARPGRRRQPARAGPHGERGQVGGRGGGWFAEALAFQAARRKQGTTDTPNDQESLAPQPHRSRWA